MKECRYCGSTYADSLSACPNCGGSKIVTAQEMAEEIKLQVKEAQNQENAVAASAAQGKKPISRVLIALGILAAIVLAIVIAVSVGEAQSFDRQNPQVGVAYENGQKFFDSGKYEEAIKELAQVPVESKYYGDAQSLLGEASDKYRSAMLDRVNTYTQNGEHETALLLIEEAQLVLPGDGMLATTYDSTYTAYIDSVITKAASYSDAADYETAVGILSTAKNKYPQDARLEASYVATYASYKKQICENAISVADAYAASKDYLTAIETLNAASDKVGQDETLTAKIETYTEAYKQDLFTAARSAYHSDGYQAAVSILQDGKTVLGEDVELAQLIKDYSACVPTPVRELDCIYWPLTQDGPSWTSDESWMGEEYVNYGDVTYPRFYRSYTSYDWDSWTIVYDLQKEYELLSGTLLFRGEYAEKNVGCSGWIKIYGDGDLLYYGTVTYSKRSEYFSVNLNNVEYLKITISRAKGYIGNGMTAQMMGISEFNIYENIMP